MAGRSLRTFAVLPHLPERLQALQKLAYNMWWCWNHEAVSLLRRIDDDLFDAVEVFWPIWIGWKRPWTTT